MQNFLSFANFRKDPNNFNNRIDSFQESDFQKAEIFCAQKHVICGFSGNSCKKTVDLSLKKCFQTVKLQKNATET